MILEERIEGFKKLGKHIQTLKPSQKELLYINCRNNNSWFTTESIDRALDGIAEMLSDDKLKAWLLEYPELKSKNDNPKKIGVIMAGNIPGVGFHDLLSVLITGNSLFAKLSSQDNFFLREISSWLLEVEPRFQEFINFVDIVKGVDAYIATGSDNSSRYFEKYFKNKPNIIRSNMSSCTVLTGNETEEDFHKLGEDIFLYFGLGCRNVSKLYVPFSYDFTKLLDNLEIHRKVIDHHKYANNYDYNKSIFLVNKVPHLDTGYALLTESESLNSAISVLHYEFYKDNEDLENKLKATASKIQCIVGLDPKYIPFRKSQKPELKDYADRVDTIEFLISLV